MKNWLRIIFFSVLGLGLLATSEKTDAAAPAENIQLKLVYYTTPGEAKPTYVIQAFVNKVKERSGGRLEIKIIGGPEVFAPPDLLAKCKAGLADLVFCPAGYWAATAPELAFDGLPYDVSWDGLSALMDATRPLQDGILNQHGCKLLGNLYLPGAFYLATKAPIQTMADLKGRSIRGHGLMPAILIEAVGASAVVLPTAELVGALERGVVGGAMVAAATIQDLKFWDLGVKHCVQYAMAFAFTCNVVTNQTAYRRLPPDLQKILSDVGREMEKAMVSYWKEQEGGVIADCKARGITFYTLPADEAKRGREATVAKAGPAFLGRKGVDKGIAQQFVDLMKRTWR